jgi:hypothetical protein
MEKLSKKIVRELLQIETFPAVTIYIPMHTSASPPHMSANQIRLKNLLQSAADQLRRNDNNSSFAAQLEDKIADVCNDMAFWENQTPGLLLCAVPDDIRLFQLPIDTEEYVAVDQQFHLAPILGLLHDQHDFYVLALAQQNPRLCYGDMYGLHPTDIALPGSIREALNLDEAHRKTENQGTAAGPSTQGKASAPSEGRGWFNGRGGAKDPAGADRLRFFRMIDSAINRDADRSLPLVLAGTDTEIAEYRQLSKYPHILSGTIAGNQTGTNHYRQLFEAGNKIVHDELVTPDHYSAVEEYLRIGGAHPERVAQDGHTISKAATEGRIDKLLLGMIQRTADTVRDTTEEVLRITFPDSKESRRLNDIALRVWRTSGTVCSLLPSEMPQGQLIAARLRY